MYQGGPNPCQIQLCPLGKRSSPPLPVVLMHDGGGTTFSYFVLGSLGRAVWGVHNPHYWSNEVFEGGVDGMARLYVGLMEEAGISGTILLGGWSMGGYLSLAVANLLAQTPQARIRIAGIVMMDTPFHEPRATLAGPIDNPVFPHLPQEVRQAFARCDEMLLHWPLPAWTSGTGPVSLSVDGKRIPLAAGQTLRKPLDGAWEVLNMSNTCTPTPPAVSPQFPEAVVAALAPCVLIRCVRAVPLPEGRREGFLIDRHRERQLLGWEGHPHFIKAVMDFDSDHYGMFDRSGDALPKLTAMLNEALDMLQGLLI